MKIPYKITFIAIGIILLISSALSFWQYHSMKVALLAQSQKNMDEVSSLLVRNTSVWLNERINTVQGLSEILAQNKKIEKIDIYHTLNSKRLNNLAAYYYGALDIDGQPISPTWQPKEGWDARAQPWYDVAKLNNTTMMTAPYLNPEDNRLSIRVVSQIFQGHQSVGVMGADIDLSELMNMVSAVNFNGTGYAYLVSQDGKIISQKGSPLFGLSIKSLYGGLTPVLTDELQVAMIRNKKVLTAFYPLKNVTAVEKNWYVGVVIDEPAVLAPAIKVGLKTMMIAMVMTILSVAILYLFILQSIIKPIRSLTVQTNEISQGKFTDDIVGIKSSHEIGKLAQSIQRLQRSLKLAMFRLSDQE